MAFAPTQSRLAAADRLREAWKPGGLWMGAHLLIFGVALTAREVGFGPAAGHALRSPADLFFHWDSAYFAGIAQVGYFGQGSNATWPAFFPGFPLAGRLLLALTGDLHPTHGQEVASLGLVALVASLIAALLIWRLAQREYGDRVAAAATLLFVAGPYSVFLVAPYSEPMFVAFAIGAWLLAERGRWWQAGLLGAFACLTRIEGVFLVAGLGVAVAVELRRRGAPFLLRSLGTLAIGLTGLLAYWGALWAWTGNPAEWFAAERAGWHRSLSWPWVSLANTVGAIFTAHPLSHQVQNAFDLLFAALFVAAIVVLLRRRAWAAVTFVGLIAAAMMTSTTYLSIARASVVLFPVTVLVASTVLERRRRWIYWTALAGGAALLIVNTVLFVNGIWVD